MEVQQWRDEDMHAQGRLCSMHGHGGEKSSHKQNQKVREQALVYVTAGSQQEKLWQQN